MIAAGAAGSSRVKPNPKMKTAPRLVRLRGTVGELQEHAKYSEKLCGMPDEIPPA